MHTRKIDKLYFIMNEIDFANLELSLVFCNIDQVKLTTVRFQPDELVLPLMFRLSATTVGINTVLRFVHLVACEFFTLMGIVLSHRK